MGFGLQAVPENDHLEYGNRAQDELGVWRRWSVKGDEPSVSPPGDYGTDFGESTNSTIITRTSWLLDSEISDLETSNRNSVSSLSSSILSRSNSGGSAWFKRLSEGPDNIIRQEIIIEEPKARARPQRAEFSHQLSRGKQPASRVRADSHQAEEGSSYPKGQAYATPTPYPPSILSPVPRTAASTKRLSWVDAPPPPRKKRWYEDRDKPASFSFKLVPRSKLGAQSASASSGSVPTGSRVGGAAAAASGGSGHGPLVSDLPFDEYELGRVIASLVSLLPDVPDKGVDKPVNYAIVPRMESGCWVATAQKDALNEGKHVDGRTQFKISLK